LLTVLHALGIEVSFAPQQKRKRAA